MSARGRRASSPREPVERAGAGVARRARAGRPTAGRRRGRRRARRPAAAPSSTSGSRSEKFRCTGPGPAVERGPEGAAGEPAQPAHPLGRRRVVVDLDEPLRGAAVELDLVDRLAGADVAQLRRAVGGEHEQRHARLVRLDHRGRVVRRRGSRRARERHRQPARLGQARARRSPPQRSSMCDVERSRGSRASESTSGVEREPGEVQASRRPQRTSSSTNARRPR